MVDQKIECDLVMQRAQTLQRVQNRGWRPSANDPICEPPVIFGEAPLCQDTNERSSAVKQQDPASKPRRPRAVGRHNGRYMRLLLDCCRRSSCLRTQLFRPCYDDFSSGPEAERALGPKCGLTLRPLRLNRLQGASRCRVLAAAAARTGLHGEEARPTT